MNYITIDGDDIGKKISSCYFKNDPDRLKFISETIQKATTNISELLISYGFDIIFCAADGVSGVTHKDIDLIKLFLSLNKIAPDGFTFSVGVGRSLRDAYIALLEAKSNGKNCLFHYDDVIRID